MGDKKQKNTLNYYGGDTFNENDEESLKLYLSDCRKRQAALYPVFQNLNSSIELWMQPMSKGELLAVAGQSRFYLHLQNVQSNIIPKGAKQNNEEFDFLLFKQKIYSKLEFPVDIDAEADVVRSHGLPLLIWPQSKVKADVQKYLDEHYPDCGFYFGELDKGLSWLNLKLFPLASGLGLTDDAPIKLNSTESETHQTKCWLTNFPTDSVASDFIRKRLAWYKDYTEHLKSYLVNRLQATPAFHYNILHRKLFDMSQLRASNLVSDSSFLSLVGNALLAAIAKAQNLRRQMQFHADQVLNHLGTDRELPERQQGLFLLLPAKKLSTALSKRKSELKKKVQLAKRAKLNPLEVPANGEIGTDEESDDDADSETGHSQKELDLNLLSDEEGDEFDDDDSVMETGEEEADGVKKLQPTNRPMTKTMLDNRGLMKYRHKRERNPRVHMRFKYKKATIRYRSRMPPARHETKPYAGEARGIRVNLVKSHHFKNI